MLLNSRRRFGNDEFFAAIYGVPEMYVVRDRIKIRSVLQSKSRKAAGVMPFLVT